MSRKTVVECDCCEVREVDLGPDEMHKTGWRRIYGLEIHKLNGHRLIDPSHADVCSVTCAAAFITDLIQAKT